jgi:hypothetical protein
MAVARSFGALWAGGLLCLFAGGSAGAAAPAGPQLRVGAPAAGHVTLLAARLTLPDVPGRRHRLRVPLALRGTGSAKAVGAVLARRAGASTIYTMLLALVGSPAAGAGVAGAAPSPPVDGTFGQRAAAAFSFPSGSRATPAPPVEVAVTPPSAAGFSVVAGPRGAPPAAIEAIDVDAGTPAEREALGARMRSLGDPLAVLSDRRTSFAQFDDAHRLGWKSTSPATKRAARDAWSLPSAAPHDITAIVERLAGELGLGAGQPAPPPPGGGGLYRFSTAGFSFGFDAPPHGQVTRVTFTSPGATACGTDPATSVWSLPYTVEAGAPASGSVTVKFADANPFQIYLFYDYLPPGSIESPLATVRAALSPVAGPAPQLQVTLAATGAVANTSGPTPSLLPITRTPVASC